MSDQDNHIDRMSDKLKAVWKEHPHLTLTQIMWELGRSEYAFMFVKDEHIEKRLDQALGPGKKLYMKD